MSDDLSVFRDVVLWLFQRYQKPWEYETKASKIYETIRTKYESISDERELGALLPTKDEVDSEASSKPRSKYLYLQPIDNIFVPVLSIKYDFSRSIPKLRLRVGIFREYEEDIRAFGYRFEAPEGPGQHHYYHAQVIHGFEKGQPFFRNPINTWLSDHLPALPLEANDPVCLMLCVLISLYGLSEVVIDLKRSSNIDNIQVYIEKLQCLRQPQPMYWYRKLETTIIETEKSKLEYFAINDPGEFETQTHAKYRGVARTRIFKMTEEAYANATMPLPKQTKVRRKIKKR